MTTTTDHRPSDALDVVSDLYRLIQALDGRMPRLERSGEAEIARDAADLRLRAVNLIRRIEAGTTGP